MADHRNQSPVSERFACALLATTCLTAASGIAAADTVIEGQGGAPVDFANSFAQAYLLPLGTTTVQGAVGSGEYNDFFEFQGLTAESAFSFSIPGIPCCEGLHVSIDNSSALILASGNVEEGLTLSGTVPSDGNLVVGFETEGGYRGYEIDLVSGLPASPEPATLPAAGLALAGALAWRRKRISSDGFRLVKFCGRQITASGRARRIQDLVSQKNICSVDSLNDKVLSIEQGGNQWPIAEIKARYRRDLLAPCWRRPA
jgi:hypothetical protein